MDRKQHSLSTERSAQVSLRVGLAVCEALSPLVPDVLCQVKWPNDVYLAERKVCGILIESPASRPELLVLGIGINVNNTLSSAPEEVAEHAIAMCDTQNHLLSIGEVLRSVVGEVLRRCGNNGIGEGGFQELWAKRCLLTGREVTLETNEKLLHGVCRGIDKQGALLLETGAGLEPCMAGTVRLREDSS